MTPLETRHMADAEEFLRGRSRAHSLLVHTIPWRRIGAYRLAATFPGTPLRVLVDAGHALGRDAVCFTPGEGREARSFIVIRPGEGRMELVRHWQRGLDTALAYVKALPQRVNGAGALQQSAPA